jgi:hypothetical protein
MPSSTKRRSVRSESGASVALAWLNVVERALKTSEGRATLRKLVKPPPVVRNPRK